MRSLAFDTLGPVIAAHAVAAIVMAFVPPDETGVRVSAVIVILSLCLAAIGQTNRATDEGQCYAEYAFGFIVHANCFLVLLKLEAPRAIKGRWGRLRWACVALFTPRRTLPVEAEVRKETPNRRRFVQNRTLEGLLCGALFLYLKTHTLLPFPLRHSDLAPEHDSLVHQIVSASLTIRAFLVRAETTLLSLLMPALLLNAAHCIASAFFVMVASSSPKSWPPLFGNITAAYSVRRWYSHFWEKLMRKGFTINAAFFTTHVLRLQPNSTLGRSSIVMVSFLLSGIMHTAAGWTPGPCASWRPLWSYLVTCVVILSEQAVQWAYQRAIHGDRPWKNWELRFWRGIGYCWVAAFWLEVLPRTIFPGMRCHWSIH